MLKRIFLFFVIILITFSFNLFSDDDECAPYPPGPGNPGNDNADETLSYSDENGNRFYFITPDVLIYKRGYYEVYKKPKYGEKENALTDLNNSGETLLNSGRILIIPTGALFSVENDTTLKHVLEQYVSLGGTLVVFAQQYGSHVENVVPIPEGESLKVYGWRESQSCLWGSIFFNKENMHPVLSAMTNEKVSAPVDGYFSQIPSGSQILLQSITNNEAALFMYPYGENGGHVILTSLYTDWGYAHSQASASELKLVRDLITFAKNPNLPISMYDLETEPNPQIDLNVTVKNNTEDTDLTASKVKLKVYTPDRKTVLYETEQSVSLSAGAEAEIPISFTLPDLQSKDFGICHV